jgi:probable phosphoglycerate mutase
VKRVTLYLARHGETDWNAARRWQGQTDVPLNATGRAQARELAVRARTRGIVSVGSSDLCRARETACIVSEALGGVRLLSPDPALRERDFGSFEGLTREECQERYPDAWARYGTDARMGPPDAEPHEEFCTRVRTALLRAAASVRPTLSPRGSKVPREPKLLLVVHGGVLRSIASDPRCAIPNVCMFRVVIEGERLAEVTTDAG